MSATSSRREFLSQGLPAPIGIMAWAAQQPNLILAADDTSKTTSTPDLAKKLTESRNRLLAAASGRQRRLVDEREPGITALVVTALLRPDRSPPVRRRRDQGSGLSREFIGPKGGLSEAASRQLLDVDRAAGLPGGQREAATTARSRPARTFLKNDAMGRERR